MTDFPICCVCEGALGLPELSIDPPSLTSLATILPVRTEVKICNRCGHIQSPELPDSDHFYDTGYGISLSSTDHDQLYEVRDGQAIYRTDRQAEIVLALAKPDRSARVLDYGAAKAGTLRKIVLRRPDIEPYVFDVSEDYRASWAAWLDPTATATYTLPAEWQQRFDLISAHYVLEHIPDPLATLRKLHRLMAPGGRLFISVPDWSQNIGDLIVVDHRNHFTESSIRFALAAAGFEATTIDRSSLPAAFAVVARPTAIAPAPWPRAEAELRAARAACEAWTKTHARGSANYAGRTNLPAAIYGAGVYGSFLRLRAGAEVPLRCFIDNNRHLWGRQHLGLMVRPPAELPDDVRVVYVGLNPARARQIVAETPVLVRRNVDLIYLDLESAEGSTIG